MLMADDTVPMTMEAVGEAASVEILVVAEVPVLKEDPGEASAEDLGPFSVSCSE